MSSPPPGSGPAPARFGQPAVPPGPRTSAILFAWESVGELRRTLPALLATAVDEVVVLYGGTDGSREFVEGLRDPKLVSRFEERRLGKAEALNRGVDRATGSVVFLISADVRFEPSVLEKLASGLGGGAGVAFPRVVPANVRGWVSRLGALLWQLREVELEDATSSELPFHGGELQAVRRELLDRLPPVVNDDALVCLRAHERGFSLVYVPEAVVENTVPETVAELLEQRVRINFGHFQLRELGYAPATLETVAWRHPGLFLRLLWRGILRRPRGLGLLPLLVLLEAWAILRGFVDHETRADHLHWKLVRSGKFAAS